MRLRKVTNLKDIREGDALLITLGSGKFLLFYIREIKIVGEEHEIILTKNGSVSFFFENYIKNVSLVKKAYVVEEVE